MTANWESAGDNIWTVPLGGVVGKVMKIGKMPVNMQLLDYGNVVTPDNGADWQLRFQVRQLFPK